MQRARAQHAPAPRVCAGCTELPASPGDGARPCCRRDRQASDLASAQGGSRQLCPDTVECRGDGQYPYDMHTTVLDLLPGVPGSSGVSKREMRARSARKGQAAAGRAPGQGLQAEGARQPRGGWHGQAPACPQPCPRRRQQNTEHTTSKCRRRCAGELTPSLPCPARPAGTSCSPHLPGRPAEHPGPAQDPGLPHYTTSVGKMVQVWCQAWLSSSPWLCP